MSEYSKFPLVSITVITYNSSKYIIETLESIKNQTYQNIELIVSDDCSKDNTVFIVKDWIEKNKDRFVDTQLITSPENTGIPANKNRALSVVKGIWLKSIAGDDLLLENCIKENIEYSATNPDATIIASNLKVINENGEQINDHLQNEFCLNLSAKQQYKRILRYYFLSSPGIFLKTDVIKENNYYNESYRWIEDYPFYLKVLKSGNKIYYLPSYTVKYRVHSKSITSNVSYNKKENSFVNDTRMFLKNEIMKGCLEERLFLSYILRNLQYINNKYNKIKPLRIKFYQILNLMLIKIP